jgi:dipeptidyl aminopeptidase/acylaminoacyl peptidase
MDEDRGVASVAFSPDGRVLAAGALDGTTRLVEVETGREIIRLRGHERSVAAVAFTPDGRVLATAEGLPESVYWKEQRGPQTIRFWDLATGRELARLAGHHSNVNALAFHPDGRRLVTGLSNGNVLTWEHPAAARLARPVSRKLTSAELRGYWNDLAGDDARRAGAAVGALAASNEGVAFLAGLLRPAAKLDVRKVRGWLTDLDSNQFAVREQASRLLGQLGEDSEAELQRALTKETSLEVRRRIEKLQDAFLRSPPPERLRELRAVWALEKNGSAEARKILTRLAGGDSEARLTREAKAVLARRGRE